MFTINDDKSIYITRGDAALLNITAENEDGQYIFRQGELVRFRVFERKNCSAVALIKDVTVTSDGETVQMYLSGEDTRIGGVISKPADYWYEVEINPLTSPQTIIGYDGDGPKIFRLFPEGDNGKEDRPSGESSLLSGKALCGYVLDPDAVHGKSAYEIALLHGFEGTEEEWIKSVTAEADRAEKAAENATKAATDEVTRLVGEIGVVQTAGGSEAKVMSQKAVTDEINALKSPSLFDYTEYLTTTWIEYQGAGTGEGTSYHNCIKIPCKEGEKYAINFNGTTTVGTPCFVRDSDNTCVQTIFNNSSDITEGDTEFTIVPNGVMLIINYETTTYNRPTVYKYVALTTDEITALYSWKDVDYTDYITENCYEFMSVNSGESDNGLNCAKIPCKEGELYKINFDSVEWNTNGPTPCFVRNADGVAVAAVIRNITDITEGDTEFAIPCGGTTIVVNYDNTNGVAPKLYKYGVPTYEDIEGCVNKSEIDYPTYWKTAISTAEGKIEQYQNEGGVNLFTFGFITDTHVHADTSGAFAKIMERVMDTCDIPIFLHGGDIVAGIGIISKSGLIDQILHHKEIFKDIEDKCLLALGNHDPAFGVTDYYDSNLTDGEIYNYIFRKDQKKDGIIYGDTGRYFYKDIPTQKVRYIILDGYDFETDMDENQLVISNNKMRFVKFGVTQLLWLANTALNVPEGYSVVICSHMPPYRESDKNAIGWTGEDYALDCDVALGVVNAFRDKTKYTYSGTIGTDTIAEEYAISTDFTAYNGDMVCWIAGHTHKDYIFDIDGLKVVCTANCSRHVSEISAPAKTSRTATEYIMDFLCVNKATRTCNIVRLGAELEGNAEGRSFTY